MRGHRLFILGGVILVSLVDRCRGFSSERAYIEAYFGDIGGADVLGPPRSSQRSWTAAGYTVLGEIW